MTKNDLSLENSAQAFVRFLEKKGQLKNLPQIIQKLHRLENDLKKIEIVSAVCLNQRQQNSILKEMAIKKTTEYIVKNTVDPKIGGGLVIKVNDKVIDLSLKGRLDQLKLKLAD